MKVKTQIENYTDEITLSVKNKEFYRGRYFMKKILIIMIVLSIAMGMVFADSTTTSTAMPAKANVTFNLKSDGQVDGAFKFVAGFTNDNSAVNSEKAPALDAVTPTTSLEIKDIVIVEGKNVGQLSEGAFVYWIIAGNKNVQIALTAPDKMTGTIAGNELGLTTEITDSKDRGSENTNRSLANIFTQGTDDAFNWGYAQLKFTTGDLAATNLKADSYKAELTLNIISSK